MKYDYDVMVIGAGGAGLCVAGELAQKGYRVGLADLKNDILKVSFHTLGSFIEYKKFGLSSKVIASRLTELFFASRHISFAKKGKAFILDKTQLHRELLAKAKKHKVVVHAGAHIVQITFRKNGDVLSVQDNRKNIYTAKIFIDASGVHSFLSKKMGLQEASMNSASGLELNVKYLGSAQRAYLFIGNLFQGGYGWLFPLGNNRAILGIGSFDSMARQQLKKRLDEMFNLPSLKGIVEKDRPTLYGGTIPITPVKTKFVKGNVVCVGDSVSQVNPLVGEGYRFILESAQMAANHIDEALQNDNNSLLHDYEIEWRKKFYKKYLRAKKLQDVANRASKSELMIDFLTFLLMTKRDQTFVKLIAGELNAATVLLP